MRWTKERKEKPSEIVEKYQGAIIVIKYGVKEIFL